MNIQGIPVFDADMFAPTKQRFLTFEIVTDRANGVPAIRMLTCHTNRAQTLRTIDDIVETDDFEHLEDVIKCSGLAELKVSAESFGSVTFLDQDVFNVLKGLYKTIKTRKVL